MSSRAKRSKTSPIWSFFTSVNDTEKIAQCDICSKKLCYSSSVTNLKKHIERKHPIINLQISKASPHSSTEITTDDPAATFTHIAAPSSTPVSAQGESAVSSSHTATPSSVSIPPPPRQSSISSFVARKISETQKKKLNTILLKLFFLDFQPFSIVEDRGFVELIRALNPSYQLPTRKAITTTLLPAAYEQCKNVVLEKHLVELEEPVKATIALINKDLPVLTEREWDICRDLCKILKPFEEVTRKLSGENYATGSQVIVLTRGLAAVCKKLQNEKPSSTVESILQYLLKGISERFQSIEYSRTLAMCTFLDPRFKMIGFSDQIAADSIKKHIIELVTKKLNQERHSRPEVTQQTFYAVDESGFSVWEDFDKEVATVQLQGK
ncbi:hypothetical protein ANN_28077 [Periplaneta americana]|uniref:BED-type domain-containing protein n=1 Tax=Periplaneta americana TaxID=6978 RepID=A0ABQ8RUV9_PERAM|nr:hypothetical protein ANN_28077 [Periplaneta americana]